MKCPSCSHVNRAIATFCSKCGESMTPEPAKEEVPATVENHSMALEDTPRRKSLSPKIVYSLMALIVIAGIAFASWSNDKITSQEATIVKLGGMVDQQNQSINSLNDWGNSTAELINSQDEDLQMRLACLELESIRHEHDYTKFSGDYAGTWDPLGYNAGFSYACNEVAQTITDGGNNLYASQLRAAKTTKNLLTLCPKVMTPQMKKYYERFPDVTHEGIFRICYE